MTTPDDRESKPESSPAPEGRYSSLPPRLREKLDSGGGGGDEDFDFLKKKSSPVGLIITIVVVVIAVGGIVMLVHNSREKAKAEAAQAAATAAAVRAAAVADSLAQIRQADSLAAVARADSIAFAKLPRWKQKQILAAKAKAAGGAAAASAGQASTAGASTAAKPPVSGASPSATTPSTPAEPAAPKEKGPYGLDAGQFLDEAKANQVSEDLKTKTGLAARVVNMGDTYHVILGSYASRAAAEAKANALLAKGQVEQAGVVPLPKSK